MSIKDEYSTIVEATSYLGVTRQSISRWLREGKLRAEAIGRVKLMKNSDLHKLKYELMDEDVKRFVSYRIFTIIQGKKHKRGRIMTIKDLEVRSKPNKNFSMGGWKLEILWESGKKSILITANQTKIGSSEDDEDVIIDESKTVYQIMDI